MYRLLARSKASSESLGTLRRAISGGDALPSSVRDAYVHRFGQDLLEGREAHLLRGPGSSVSMFPPRVGQAPPAGRSRACRSASWGRTVKTHNLSGGGEIQVLGPERYPPAISWKRPEEDAAAFTADGWFRTGDRGSLDPESYLTVSGRIKELIIRDGEKIMPREIERRVLGSHPGVLDAAVVGEPDGPRGQAVVAYVVPADQAPTADELVGALPRATGRLQSSPSVRDRQPDLSPRADRENSQTTPARSTDD